MGNKNSQDRYILGAGRFAGESSRIVSSTESPLHFIDENLYQDSETGEYKGHSIDVLNTARINGFGDVKQENIRIVNDYSGTDVANEGRVFRTIIGEYDSALSNKYVVNVSYGPIFDTSTSSQPELIPVDLLKEKQAAFLVATGNSSSGNSHGEAGGLAAARAGFVLFVTGVDYQRQRAGRFVLDSRASPCLWAKEFCVAASFTVRVSSKELNGTSFSTPLVSAQLANARLLWPNMTSEQTLELARYCARPVRSDGTLGAWGTILTAEQADDNLGQGVFSVECLYNANGALRNPITGIQLTGVMSLRGVENVLRLSDAFGRSYTLSENVGGAHLPLLPMKPDKIVFGTDRVIGFGLSFINMGFRFDENEFFGTRGTGDFIIGDSFNVFLQLSHRLAFDRFYLDLYMLSVWARMNPVLRSVVREAQGFNHQLTARLGYHFAEGRANVFTEWTHNFGVSGKVVLADVGVMTLRPRAQDRIGVQLNYNF